MKLAFVNRFPEMVLQQFPNGKMLEINELISTVRVQTAKRTQEVAGVAKPGVVQ